MSDTFFSKDISPCSSEKVFAYQQTKRLHLVIDQLLWSFEHLATLDQLAVCQAHLHQMVAEAKNHIAHLDRPPI